MLKKILLPAVLSALCAGQAAAQDACRQALVFGLDVSGSVDSREYRMQLDGLAAALLHPEIEDALLAIPGSPVRLAAYEWSGPRDQIALTQWTAIRSAADITTFAAQLRQTTRSPSEQSTALGNAIVFGADMLASQSGCWKRTLDISGDGTSNTGPNPQDIPQSARDAIVVNGLVIGADSYDHGDDRQHQIGELSSYFNAYVISGPASFVEVALGFEDYEAAMVRKLKRELSGFALSQLPEARGIHAYQ